MKQPKKIRVLATGVFDLLHPGHIYYLEESKKLGDELVVLIAHDAYVQKTKGTPLFSATSRKHLVEALACVDSAVIPDITDPEHFYRTVLAINPDIITLGFNQQWDEAAMQADFARYGWRGRIVRLKSYPNGAISSSQLKARIKEL